MATFDPSKPIDDPQVWFPKGMFVDNTAQKLTIKVYDVDTPDDEDKTFILNHDKMVALSRFLWTGKLLPTDRDAYIKTLGLITTEEITDEVWTEIDHLLGTYTEISKDCTQFKEVTWDKLVDLSGQIKTYATVAGGTPDSSYYQAVLEWVGEYNTEKNKTNPDQKTLDDLAAGIKGAIEDEQKKISGIQEHITDAVKALNTFHDNCKGYEKTLEDDGTTLQNLLEKEGNDIEHLSGQISEELKEIEDLQTEIDRDHQKIHDTAYYVWIPFIGTIAGITVALIAEADIKRLKESMEKIQAALDANEAKLQTAYALQGDITSMGTQLTGLVKVIKPAIATLEALQGAWAQMNTDLQTLYDLFEDDKQSVPPMLLLPKELNTIVQAWNDLKDYADDYIQYAFMTDDPEKVTIQNYVDQLGSQLN
ncbi:uncharacterized protein TRIVIDRAFT_111733 [Trichoderma virens Gv29-8]|uniref:Uncharacterized protein n=1 Tax=Hypocrea virens (strain Gv29-8 / FGSC 10586) TaxID=413071 RepID=G9MZB0_HYPVG|nr:uncharacterized protein TRIVIDRAFT_111733 [Trichoderma virens Gv29-8]EHK19967.1 hypothetical protein TRIVIDRAFT_111733 [Trichoderma virens Gv29-8]UKZ46084.1 hypothetical protein TrVGV298_000281 [Trichoderma virens]